MNAFELYQQLGKRFEVDPTAKELPVCIVDNECGEMEAVRVDFRPRSIVDGKPMNMVRLDW